MHTCTGVCAGVSKEGGRNGLADGATQSRSRATVATLSRAELSCSARSSGPSRSGGAVHQRTRGSSVPTGAQSGGGACLPRQPPESGSPPRVSSSLFGTLFSPVFQYFSGQTGELPCMLVVHDDCIVNTWCYVLLTHGVMYC